MQCIDYIGTCSEVRIIMRCDCEGMKLKWVKEISYLVPRVNEETEITIGLNPQSSLHCSLVSPYLVVKPVSSKRISVSSSFGWWGSLGLTTLELRRSAHRIRWGKRWLCFNQ
jgi:hypothetical protein